MILWVYVDNDETSHHIISAASYVTVHILIRALGTRVRSDYSHCKHVILEESFGKAVVRQYDAMRLGDLWLMNGVWGLVIIRAFEARNVFNDWDWTWTLGYGRQKKRRNKKYFNDSTCMPGLTWWSTLTRPGITSRTVEDMIRMEGYDE